MAHVVTDRVRETTTTTGTGAITPLGAVTNYQTFSSQMANADTTVYAIIHQTLAEWEVGLGTWNTGNTITRTTVVRSSNANAAVSFSAGTKDIFMTFNPTVRQPGMTFASTISPAVSGGAQLGTTTLRWNGLHLASGLAVNWANGEITLTGGGDQLVVDGGSLVVDIGTATVPPLLFDPTGAVLMTTAGIGAVEMDATNFYATTDAGNRGYLPVRHFIRNDAGRTYTSNVSSQAIFNSPTNGRLTLETGTYLFDGLLSFGSMDAAAASNRLINILGAGTATVAAWVWQAIGQDGATGTAAASSSSHMITSTSPASVITGVASATMMVALKGTFEVTGAGTLIPSTTMAVAAASTLSIGSWMAFERIGTTSVVSVGQWD